MTAAPRDLWHHVGEVVLHVDADGRITAVSPSAGPVLGHDPDRLLGTPVVTLVHPDERIVIEARLARSPTEPTEQAVSLRAAHGDGDWVEARAWLRSAPGEGLVLVIRPVDGSEARLVESERQAVEQLQRLEDLKQELTETVARELRHPLTIISGFAQTLQRPGFTVDGGILARIGRSIDAHAVRLQQIVGDLFELDRAGRRSLRADVEPADLAELVLDVVEHVALGPRQLRLALEPVRVPVDPARFQRIVEILLDNVAQHTPPDTTAWVRLSASPDGALLEVADDGPGLSETLRWEVFSPFARGRVTGSSGGLGVGLALVRRYAELHGGRCWVENGDGGGAAFSVYLPASLPSPAETEHEAPSAAAPIASDTAVTAMLRTVRDELGMRVAYLSRFTETEQEILAVAGEGQAFGLAPGVRVPLEETYCARMVRGEIDHLVVDTSVHPQLRELEATRSGIACYAGVPVRLPDGHVIGSLCAIDDRPRPDLRDRELSVLRAVARLLGEQVARERLVADDDRETLARVEDVLGRVDGVQMLFQPIVELATGHVAGVEALARFPDSQVRPPDVWFADAARVGLAEQLEQLAVMRALRGLDQLPSGCYLSVNLSPDTISSGGLRPLLGRVELSRIVLEVTEHAAVSDYTRVQSMLQPFRDAGARLAIDDVGSGFASLRHVLRLEPDVIKIDRSLVSEIVDDPAQRAVATAFGHLGAGLGTTLVAEGVEDRETLHVLAEAGITHAQGWFFARPGPLPLSRTSYADVLAGPAAAERGGG